MTSPLPPRLRDTRNLIDRVRQDRQNLKQLGGGMVGGRWAPAKPLGATAQMDDIEDDTTSDVADLPAAINTDRATCATAGIITLTLTYVPIDGSLLIHWGPLYQPPIEYTLVGRTVTFANPHIKVGHVLTAAYWYHPGDIPDPVITTPSDGSTTTDTTPTISGTAVGGSTVEVFVDGVSKGTATAATDGTWTLTVGSALSAGGHTITATQTTIDGETSEAEPVDFSVVSPAPATATARGTRSATGSNGVGGSLTHLALPTGTVVGDFIAVAAYSNASAALTVTDSRLTPVGSGMWVGFATDLSDIAVHATGGFGKFWSIACITFATNAVSWTSAVVTSDSSMVAGDTLPVGAIAGIGAAVCGINSWHDTVTGNCGVPGGYTIGAIAPTAGYHSRVDYWTSVTLATSPTGPTQFNGGNGPATATVVGLTT